MLTEFFCAEIAREFDLNGIDGAAVLAPVNLDVIATLKIVFGGGWGIHLR